jgi:uncharacterized membrane protein YphA (DoxX/SURF4 family)
VAAVRKAGLSDPERLVRANAALHVLGGLSLATGRLPRLSALALAGSLVPTTVVGHPFWAESDPRVRTGQRVQFVKNLGLLGGLLLAVADTGGRESLPHAASRVSRRARRRDRRVLSCPALTPTPEVIRASSNPTSCELPEFWVRRRDGPAAGAAGRQPLVAHPSSLVRSRRGRTPMSIRGGDRQAEPGHAHGAVDEGVDVRPGEVRLGDQQRRDAVRGRPQRQGEVRRLALEHPQVEALLHGRQQVAEGAGGRQGVDAVQARSVRLHHHDAEVLGFAMANLT